MNNQYTYNYLLVGEGLPAFEKIRLEDIIPSIDEILRQSNNRLTCLEKNITPTWEGIVEPLTIIEEKIKWTWGIVNHLMGVKNSKELREIYQTVQPDIISFLNKLRQNKLIYQTFKDLRKDSVLWNTLDSCQKRIITSSIREAELSGVNLTPDKRHKFNEINLELAELSTQFSNNVLDSTREFKLKLTNKIEIGNLPLSILKLAAHNAVLEGYNNATPELGPWIITLDYPVYVPFMKYSNQRNLREKVYKAFISRASVGKLNNEPLIESILKLRKEQAEILGYQSYAEMSLSKKMASDVESVEEVLEELRFVSYQAAQEELKSLKTFMFKNCDFDLEPWDISYWIEEQRKFLFDFTNEELRVYFSLEKVLEGLFDLTKRIFGVTITVTDEKVSTWHKDVLFFQVKDDMNKIIAYFYLNPYSRPIEKRGGAWMSDCIGRSKIYQDEKPIIRLPVAYLICNQTPPFDGEPSLMTFDEVTTLFHEFGHGLQHMLTTINYPGASGINNIEWDAVEVPSQFMEYWCYEKNTFFSMAKHYQTGETIPKHYYDKLKTSRNFMAGLSMLRQLHFSFLDLDLHHRYQPDGNETLFEARDRVAKKTTVMKILPEDAFLCAFSHIFAGGYAAGYYSYKWSEILSADSFSAFEEAGLEDDNKIAEVGKNFKNNILALGGSKDPLEIFKSFRGREPKTEALVIYSGLLNI